MALRTDGFQNLLPEIREQILGYLDAKTLLSASSVSTEWRRLISPVASVWRRAWKTVVHLKDEIEEGKFCRALFVRLNERRYHFDRCECFLTRLFSGSQRLCFTAIYYYGGKLATGSLDGTIRLWDCRTYLCLRTSREVCSIVTSIKFDDNILVASYFNGCISAFDPSTGAFIRTYEDAFIYAATVDFMTDANLVVSAYTSVVGWNMTTGRTVFRDSNHRSRAVKIVIGPFPGQECDSSSPTRRKILVATLEEDFVALKVATSTRVNETDMEVVCEVLTAIRIGCLCQDCVIRSNYLRPGFVYDGKFLYYVRHSSAQCFGIMCKWDVVTGDIVSEKIPLRNVTDVLAVGEKYTLIVVFRDVRDTGEPDDLVVLDTEKLTPVVTHQLKRKIRRIRMPSTWRPFIGPDLICVGEKSWLDGFDGDNDRGVVFSSIMEDNEISTLQWRLTTDQ